MNDFDVHEDGMKKRPLSDDEVEALIAGHRVEGAPPGLDAILSTMRERAERGRGVAISGALSEFIVDGIPSALPADSGHLGVSPRRSSPVAKRAAAVFAIVPAKILIGASMAAAAFGGAQAFGVVDVPLLPGPGPQVVTSIPAATVPPQTSGVPATTPTMPATSVPTSTKATETKATEADVTIPVRPTVDDAPVISRPTLPTQAAVDGVPGCEFGLDTSARPDGESPGDVPAQRPDAPGRAEVPPIDPCETGAPERSDTTPPIPLDPSRATGAPSSVPGNSGGNPGSSAPAQPPGDNSGGGNASTTNPSGDSGQGRTPPGD